MIYRIACYSIIIISSCVSRNRVCLHVTMTSILLKIRIFRALLWLWYKLSMILKPIKNIYSFLVHSQQCREAPANSVQPRSVNYHLTRKCNYQCGFCFHTAKTSFELPIDEAKKGLRLLKDAGKMQQCACGDVKFSDWYLYDAMFLSTFSELHC
jgi:uncharacterized radical SAM superfamily Fe-S cluster-containing enzyme